MMFLNPLLTPLRIFFETLAQSLDADFKREKLPEPSTLPEKINWQRTLPFLFLHGGCLAVFWVGISPISLAAALLLYVIRMFAITGFYHRYFSHRTFKTSRLFQFLAAVLGNSSMQRGPLWWAATHRHHHAHADEEEDKHSPLTKGFCWSHIGWLTSMRNFPTPYEKVHDLSRYPELVFLNRYDKTIPLLYGMLMYWIGWMIEKKFPNSGLTAGEFFVWTFFISTTLLLHGTLFINSLAHLWGNRPYRTKDDSRNNFWLSIITLGEGWHNNHHRYPHATRQGFRWWEIDITYYGLKILSLLGLIWELRPVPDSILMEAQESPSSMFN